jgi:mono/diheme cytochrome c family protein
MRRLLLLLALTSPISAQDGGQLYTLYCSACHAPDGKGATGGLFPPLAGSPWLAGAPDRAIKVILHGLHGPVEVLGKTYDLEMPPQGAVLPDDQIAAILTHVRSSWGNQAAAVTAETVQTIRATTAQRKTSWTAPELLQLHPLPLEKTALRHLVSQVYRGKWTHLPDFATLQPDSVEEEHDGIITLADSPHQDHYAMVWEGQLEVPADGEYLFSLDADDAGKILIDGENILEVHGIGPMNGSRVQRSRNQLTAGLHPIRVEYLEHTSEQGISIGWRPFEGNQLQWLTATKDTAPKARDPLPIDPVDGRPVIYRNFIAGTTPRAIGVGFPGGLNLAWSADHLGPELLWTGAFLDGTAKWLDRGTANNPPAGQNVVTLGPCKSLPAEARFKGYKLDPAGNPTFVVQIGNQILTDSWRAENETLQRTLAINRGSPLKIVISDPAISAKLSIDTDDGALKGASRMTLPPGKPRTLIYRWK